MPLEISTLGAMVTASWTLCNIGSANLLAYQVGSCRRHATRRRHPRGSRFAANAHSNPDLPGDLHELLARKIEAIGRVDRVAVQKRKQVTPPRRQPWFMPTRHHVVAFAEIDGIVGFDRAHGLFAVERSRNVGIFHKAETHRHPPESLAERLDMKPTLGTHAWYRGKLHRQRHGLLIERAHLAHVIG